MCQDENTGREDQEVCGPVEVKSTLHRLTASSMARFLGQPGQDLLVQDR